MLQTGYQGVQSLPGKLPFNGGICLFYYAQIEFISSWPIIDFHNQYLVTEPAFQPGKGWLGPVQIPNNRLGYKESQKNDLAGLYYEQKVSGFHPGDSPLSHVNAENMPHSQYVIAAKKRAGGFFILIGSDKSGLDYTAEDDTDNGAAGTAGNQFAFTGQSIFKAPVLPTFLGLNVLPPPTGSPSNPGGGNGDGSNETEIIYFSNQSQVVIGWNADRMARFGIFPLIEVWYDDSAASQGIHIASVPIYVDQQPPDTTTITVKVGAGTGFIVLK